MGFFTLREVEPHGIVVTVAWAQNERMRTDDASTPEPMSDPVPAPSNPRESSVVTVEKTLAILEIVAERGGASARDV